MHVCLLPTEVLLRIFAIFAPNDIYDYRSISHATLAALARTCMTFKEPALDTLWRKIQGFQPFISCLPGSVSSIGIQGKLTLKRPLLEGEWRLIGRYAQRIRSLTISDHDIDTIDDRVVQALISSPSPLVPNLRNLSWWDDRECFFPLLRILLGSTITSVDLDFSFNPPSFAKSALLAFLGARCPYIQVLECVYGGDSEESSDAISKALCGLRELRHLDTQVLNIQALFHLASLPSLKSLHFSLNMYNINGMQPNSTPTFSSQLDQVCITTSSPSVLTHCLRNVRFLSCRSVKLYIDSSDLEVPYDPLDIPDLIVSFSKCFSSTLETLHFDFDFDFNDLFSMELADPSYALGFDVVAPLLLFSHLKDLQLDWMCTSAIDDASLKTIAQSLPQLENVSIGTAARWLVPPSLTFIGLVHLIRYCRRLRSIDMAFDACPVDIHSEPFSKTIPNNKIARFFVGISTVIDPIAVACQLHALLPKVTTVGYWILEHSEDQWRKVNEFLGVLNKSAEIRETMGQAPQEPMLSA
ncbi:hypothetical protein DFH29DRAFT_1010184 [Suillus ampliporus]|nr:hypothetical protein DFH29DRAFT_1010184 [Suillus ampliporus]